MTIMTRDNQRTETAKACVRCGVNERDWVYCGETMAMCRQCDRTRMAYAADEEREACLAICTSEVRESRPTDDSPESDAFNNGVQTGAALCAHAIRRRRGDANEPETACSAPADSIGHGNSRTSSVGASNAEAVQGQRDGGERPALIPRCETAKTFDHRSTGAGGGDEEGHIDPDVLAMQSPELQAQYASRQRRERASQTCSPDASRCAACGQQRDDVPELPKLPMCPQCAKAWCMGNRVGSETAENDVQYELDALRKVAEAARAVRADFRLSFTEREQALCDALDALDSSGLAVDDSAKEKTR